MVLQNYQIHLFNLQRCNTQNINFNPPLKYNKLLFEKNVLGMPRIYEGEIIIPYSDGKIKIFKEGTKEILWEHQFDTEMEKLPVGELDLMIRNKILMISNNNMIHLLDLKEKIIIYEKAFDTSFYFNTDIFLNNSLFFWNESSNKYCLYDLKQDEVKWEYYTSRHTLFSVLKDDYLVISSGEGQEKLVCLDFKTGKMIWEKEIKTIGEYYNPIFKKSEGGFLRDSVFIYRNIVIVSIDGYQIAAFDIVTGKKLWNVKIDDTIVMFMFCYEDSLLYSLGSDYLYGINPIDGKIIKQIPVKNELEKYNIIFGFTYLTITDKFIYFIKTRQGRLIVMNKNTGEIVWIYELKEFVPYFFFPLIINKRLYVLTDERNLHVFEEADQDHF